MNFDFLILNYEEIILWVQKIIVDVCYRNTSDHHHLHMLPNVINKTTPKSHNPAPKPKVEPYNKISEPTHLTWLQG